MNPALGAEERCWKAQCQINGSNRQFKVKPKNSRLGPARSGSGDMMFFLGVWDMLGVPGTFWGKVAISC